MFVLIAILLAVYPVSQALHRRWTFFLVGLVVLPLPAFLPIAWVGVPAWRDAVVQNLAIALPGTIAPQPWFALDSYLAWLGGLAWIYWLAGQAWTRELRKPLAVFFALGMVLLTVIGLIGYHTARPLPFWEAERLFGPFPNRNQTANLLSLTFVLLVALLHQSVIKKNRLTPVWAVCLLVVGYGLVINFSRAGILLPILGVGAYWLISTLTMPSRKKIWVGLASLFLAAGLLLAFGGDTLERFTSGSDPNKPISDSYRLLIFRDTLAMTQQQPVWGIGLGQFPFVLPLFRSLAGGTSGIIHPESDWLWLAAEIGWPGTLIILLVIGRVLWQALRQALLRPHPLRLASVLCGVLFVIHGFFDVSGHRFGTFIPATFLFALAWPGATNGRPISPWLSRVFAIGLAGIALLWWGNLRHPALFPGRAAWDMNTGLIGKKIASGRGSEALQLADATLAWAPLDWQLYYQRGAARILERRDWPAALQDFRRANALERFSPALPNNQGIAWLSWRPELAALSWAEALRRTPPEERDLVYARYLTLARFDSRLRDQIEALGGNTLAQAIIQLDLAEDARFPSLLAGFQKKYPDVNRFPIKDRRTYLGIWAGRGNPQEVIDAFKKHPEWLTEGTIPLAFAHARLRQFETAVTLVLTNLPAPPLPRLVANKSEEALQRAFFTQTNLAAGLALFHLQVERGEKFAAISTLERLSTFSEAPHYLLYYRGKLQAESGNWSPAWDALADYLIKSRL